MKDVDVTWRDLLGGGHERGKFEFCMADRTSVIFEFICVVVLVSSAVTYRWFVYV